MMNDLWLIFGIIVVSIVFFPESIGESIAQIRKGYDKEMKK